MVGLALFYIPLSKGIRGRLTRIEIRVLGERGFGLGETLCKFS